ncbi:MAG: tRNA (guanosine(37)-N1)-methyltransferase TrmD [Pigmentiphaga sp.]|nr:tRNA (guanosine(37)-N1)-methyltransferase TrmD [Pigmentiphaga sp.]
MSEQRPSARRPRFDVITLFPEFFGPLTGSGVSGRAHARGLWHLQAWNPRDFTRDTHRTVDDRPYGGGPGMVMLAQPLEAALQEARASRNEAAADAPGRRVPVILLSPAGQRYEQPQAQALADSSGAIFVCGRYEGIDQRFIDRHVSDEWSLGDFVLSGGEPALLAMLDAAVRLLPGALNHGESARQDSFDAALSGLLDCPHYSRPEQWLGESVPEVLLSGHHQRIQAWRRQQSLRLTALRRPELIAAARAAGRLSRADEIYLAALGSESGPGHGDGPN